MKVGIIGSGGREHALCQSIKNSNKINKIYCFPGNAGTSNIAENIKINLQDLTYWNVELQEPYFSYIEASLKREN